ncbi:MAG: lysophospholipid acyltransferase family protein [Planctomycetota bacterium]|jgi:1-acyl-sn-glycerol-3-phosphate acyltransferase
MQMRELEAGYRFRPARPNRFWQGVLTPLRRRIARRMYRVAGIEVRGHEHIDAVRAEPGGTMVTVNHPAHGDPFVILEAMHRLKLSCCYIAAWQVFWGWLGLKGWAFQRMGAFSVDREGTDLRSFRAAVDILAGGRHALVIFPEGEVYHLNDRVTPLRDGAAMIAISAARRRRKSDGGPLRLIPCGIKYFHLQDPTPQLEMVMSRLEQRVYWSPRPDRPLADRIYRYAEAVLALKELEYLDGCGSGSLPERIAALSEHILAEMEQRRLGTVRSDTIPVRVKQLRQGVMQELPGLGPAGDDAQDEGPLPADEPTPEALTQARRDLEDVHLVTQLFSYPGDYVAQRPTVERIAETLAKFEEDALGVEDATSKTDRRAIVSFGPPVDVSAFLAEASGPARGKATALTTLIEQRIQAQLDSIAAND